MSEPKPLTKDQRSWLEALIDHSGRWSTGSGYYWANRSTSIRLSEALVKKGYALKASDEVYVVNDEHPVVIEIRARKEAWKKASRAASDKQQAEQKARWDRQKAEQAALGYLRDRHIEEYHRLLSICLLTWEVDYEAASDERLAPHRTSLPDGRWAEAFPESLDKPTEWAWNVFPRQGATSPDVTGWAPDEAAAKAAVVEALLLNNDL